MVNVNVSAKPMSPGARMKARAQRVRDMKKVVGVRVEPANDDMRRLLKHPRAGGFRSEGSIEWPDDTFTKRRLKEGSITLAKPPETKPPPPHHDKHKTENSAA
jgi:hypothetical protein